MIRDFGVGLFVVLRTAWGRGTKPGRSETHVGGNSRPQIRYGFIRAASALFSQVPAAPGVMS